MTAGRRKKQYLGEGEEDKDMNGMKQRKRSAIFTSFLVGRTQLLLLLFLLVVVVVVVVVVVGFAVAQLVEALSYKSEGRRFYSRWCQWNFSLT